MKSEKEIFDLGMKSMSLKTDMMGMYKRSVIEERIKGSGLRTSEKLPYIIEVKWWKTISQIEIGF